MQQNIFEKKLAAVRGMLIQQNFELREPGPNGRIFGCIVFDFFSKSGWLVIKSGTCMRKRRVKNFSELGGAFEVPPGGGGVKIQILAKKRQFSKLVYVMKTKIFLTWLEAKLQY